MPNETKPESLLYIAAACQDFIDATRARKVKGPMITEAIQAARDVQKEMRALCAKFKKDGCSDAPPCPTPPSGAAKKTASGRKTSRKK